MLWTSHTRRFQVCCEAQESLSLFFCEARDRMKGTGSAGKHSEKLFKNMWSLGLGLRVYSVCGNT